MFDGMVGIVYSFVCVSDLLVFVLVGGGMVGMVDDVMWLLEVLCGEVYCDWFVVMYVVEMMCV